MSWPRRGLSQRPPISIRPISRVSLPLTWRRDGRSNPPWMEISTPATVIPVFSPRLENQQAGLLLDNGNIYVAFGSHGGQGDYHGWLFGYDNSTLEQTMVFDVTPRGIQGGIWQSGGGPSADSNHNVFVATVNGTFDVPLGAMDYGDSF